MDEPQIKRAVAFFDGQNLYRHAKDAFGHHHPNYDPMKLTDCVCHAKGFENRGVRFYTGTPLHSRDPLWHGYWANRLMAMRRGGILVTNRHVRYRPHEVTHPDGEVEEVEVPQEKGIDIRIALDIVRLTRTNQLDVAIIFSQDQDLAEIVEEIKDISREKQRWVKIVCAFPSSPTASAKRGIEGTDWFPMERDAYDACLDPRDYRPRN